MLRPCLAAAAAVATLVLAGCGSGAKSPQLVSGGDASRGEKLIRSYGCGGCHTIPGVSGADARVGPELDGFRHKRFIAGELPNTPENATRWIEHPKSIEPGTIMPDLGVSRSEALDIVAYLYNRT